MALRPGAHRHHEACNCAAHRVERSDSSFWSAVLPIAACAVCPACLTTYAKIFSVLGIGFGLTELQHAVILVVALSASVSLSAWRSWRTRRVWPITIALAGTSLVVAGHLGSELGGLPALHILEWVGVLVLLGGGLVEHFRLGLARPRVSSPVVIDLGDRQHG